MRLIDADALYDKAEAKYKNAPTKYRLIYRGFVDDIAEAPTVDAQPVVHAKWIGEGILDGDGLSAHFCQECSNCHKVRTVDEYCSNCGAKMDL